jgi:ATP-dependent protease HslVU (ClpYQ) peptidase subunit
MTCIVGLAHQGRVIIGADSAGVAGLDMTVRADRKVFRNGEFIMGFTSSFRMGQLLAVKLSPPKYHPDVEPWRYMVDDFVENVRRCLRDGGFMRRDHDVEQGGDFLVGFRGRVFSIESDFQVGERVEGFDACGCGAPFALGSLAETSGTDDPVDRVQSALKVAERFSAGVRGPFHVEALAA